MKIEAEKTPDCGDRGVMSEAKLKAIGARVAATLNGEMSLLAFGRKAAAHDVPSLIAEVRRLRAAILEHTCGHCPGCCNSHEPDPSVDELQKAVR